MTEKTPRKPASFTASQSSNRPEAADEAPRRPRAVRDLDVVVAQPDVFALSEEEAAELEILDPSFEAPERKGWSLSRILSVRSVSLFHSPSASGPKTLSERYFPARIGWAGLL